MNKTLLAAFDFDYTVINQNSDIVVRDLLPPVEDLGNKDNWTEYMQRVFLRLYEQNFRQKEILSAIHDIPATYSMEHLLKTLHSKDVEIIIISDSNSLFIHQWLLNAGLLDTVSEIYTNPADFDSTGILNISKYHIQDWCARCPENLCKGTVLGNHIKTRKTEGVTYSRIAYIGDGHNDYCPALQLQENDLLFPRIGFTLQKIIEKNKNNPEEKLAAEIHPWNLGEQILEELLKYLNKS